MSIPKINTAIPQRRYRLGDFNVSVLGEVESGDDADYQYIAAVVAQGSSEPGLYVTVEKDPNDANMLIMRVTMKDGSEVLDKSDRWRDLDSFVNEALLIIQNILNLSDEQPYQLM